MPGPRCFYRGLVFGLLMGLALYGLLSIAGWALWEILR